MLPLIWSQKSLVFSSNSLAVSSPPRSVAQSITEHSPRQLLSSSLELTHKRDGHNKNRASFNMKLGSMQNFIHTILIATVSEFKQEP